MINRIVSRPQLQYLTRLSILIYFWPELEEVKHILAELNHIN